MTNAPVTKTRSRDGYARCWSAHAAERVPPVGRVDADTTGALLLTNDGPLAHRPAHPRYGVEKVYEVEVEGEPDERVLARLRAGVDLDDGRTAPAKARRIGPSELELV